LDQFVNTFGPFLCRTSGNPGPENGFSRENMSRPSLKK